MTKTKLYSVLLLYPDFVNDGGTETYYAFVKARSPLEAVAKAQWKAWQPIGGSTSTRKSSPRFW